MKKIGISQRRDEFPLRNEFRDALDVRLSGLTWGLGFAPIPLSSGIQSPRDYIDAVPLDGFILSGGGTVGEVDKRDALETAILDYAAKARLPVLGICRGMQMINHYQGGVTQAVSGHVGVRHIVTGPLINGTGREVNSFHEQGITVTGLGERLGIVASAQDGLIEAFRHQELPWLGIMWHPERDFPVASEDSSLFREVFGNP